MQARRATPTPTPTTYDAHAVARIRAAGRIVSEALDAVGARIGPGTTPVEIDALVGGIAAGRGASLPLKGLNGFPAGVCVSPNDVVCNGVPTGSPLGDGDIVNVAVCLEKDGYHAYADRMFRIGAVPERAARLCDIAHEAMMRGIAAIAPGRTTQDIARAIQPYAEGERVSVVRDFCGRGIGLSPFELPAVLHYVAAGHDAPLVPGMVLTVQPMLNLGRYATRIRGDGHTVATRDRSLSAEWGHTVAVTADGAEILTLA